MSDLTNAKTPPFRVSFPNVFNPRLNEMSKEMEYSLDALFKKGEDISAIKKAVQAAAEKKWGKDQKTWPKNLRLPFKDQGDKAKEKDGKMILPKGYEAGATYLTLKSKTRPGLVNQRVEPITDETDFYPGCWAIATVRAYAYDKVGNRGVSLGLQNIQKIRDDEPFGGRSSVTDDFAPIASEEDGISSPDDF